jgi:hypothetical protein
MTILTILNTIIIIFILFSQKIIKIKKNKTTCNKTLYSYSVYINKFRFSIPIRNKHKLELDEEVSRLITSSKQEKLQTLSAKFSWLKTWKEVRQFEKDYSVVDRKIVEKLISKFIPRFPQHFVM